MKKTLIIILFICIVLSIVSCDMKEQQEESVSANAQSDIIETFPTVDISSLKTKQDVYALDIEMFRSCGYAFFEANGKWYVIEQDHNSYVDDIFRIEEYTPFRVTLEDLAKVTEGMDVYEMVEVAGLPKSSSTFGMTTMNLYADDGTRACVYFWHHPVRDEDGNHLYYEMKVSSVHIYPPEESAEH